MSWVVSQNRPESFSNLEELLLWFTLYKGTLSANISQTEKDLFGAIPDENPIKKFFAIEESSIRNK